MKVRALFLAVLTLGIFQTELSAWGQYLPDQQDSSDILLSNVRIQVEATQAINDMYNFKFESAEMQFRWIRQRYPDHPLPYFLLGLSEWWKIMPNPDDTQHDEKFLEYMNISIDKAEKLYKDPQNRIEMSFFLAGAHGFKGRLYSDRSKWGKAANQGRLALKYHEMSRGNHDLSPEFLFGDGLYNYYSVWIRENYKWLRPIMIAFPKGDKDLGIQQLRDVATKAFYTRTEAQLFLMRILALEENDRDGALQIAEYLHQSYPDNPYFHRFYTRLLYSAGKYRLMQENCLTILERIEEGMPGYEANSGRYAGFFMGQMNQFRGDYENAKKYYKIAVGFGEEIEAYETGYFIYSLLNLARIADQEEDYEASAYYMTQIKKYAKRKHPAHKEAKEYLKKYKKREKELSSGKKELA